VEEFLYAEVGEYMRGTDLRSNIAVLYYCYQVLADFLYIIWIFCLFVLGIKPKASHMPGNLSTTSYLSASDIPKQMFLPSPYFLGLFLLT
jgi:hypothetical protein